MRILDLGRRKAERITAYESADAWAVLGGRGEGQARVHVVYLEPGGRIGRHPTGSAQLFVVVAGTGWVEGEDGLRRRIEAGEAAWFGRGETHAKGSQSGMTAVMIQVDELSAVGA